MIDLRLPRPVTPDIIGIVVRALYLLDRPTNPAVSYERVERICDQMVDCRLQRMTIHSPGSARWDNRRRKEGV